MILNFNKIVIQKNVGPQGHADCGIYSCAYGWAMLEGRCRVSGTPASNSAIRKAYNGNTSNACNWKGMKKATNDASAKKRYEVIINEISSGRPVVVSGQGSSINHYVLVIGFKDGKTKDTVKPSDFYIIDPVGAKPGWYGSTPGTKGKNFNGSHYGNDSYCFKSNKKLSSVSSNSVAAAATEGVVTETVSKEWYIEQYGTGAEVYFELQKYGYSHKACCAVLGNMQQESGIRVYTGGSYDGNGSEGLCQWTFGRKTAMQKYATDHSATKTWKSVDGQVAYLVYELEHSEKKANAVLHNESLTLEQMTEEFEKAFERAGVPRMSARIRYAQDWDRKMANAGSATSGGTSVNMVQRISKLYSSQNYEYVTTEVEEEREPTPDEKFKQDVKSYINSNSFIDLGNTVASIPEALVTSLPVESTKQKLIRTSAKFNISEALVQAPFIELDIAGYTVGSYHGSLDSYPNYLSRMDVKKINGEINQYTIGMVYQIRPGEDPTLIDKLLSKVRYNKIGIRYGDCESGALFKDSEAIITNIVSNRDYANSRINYTIYATSACNYVTSIKFDFKATQDKPSNIIRNLLYESGQISSILLEAFPGMADRLEVERKNLIPTNDSVLNIEAKSNISSLSYINYLVGCMSNVTNSVLDVVRNSLYFITYEDDNSGSYFKIEEVQKTSNPASLATSIFDVVVGYPDGNDIYNFNISTNNAWSLMYENNNVSGEYIYGINDSGENTLNYSPNLVGSSQILNEMQKNWWTQVTTFPITAQLSMRGLLKPITLMDYINVDVVFYGQRHISSGLYVVTGQQDTLDGSGFLTNLSLLRVGD